MTRSHDASQLTVAELERAKRELQANFSLITLGRSDSELGGLSWGRAVWWYSLITPATTRFRRRDRRPATSRARCTPYPPGRCRRDWCGLWPL